MNQIHDIRGGGRNLKGGRNPKIWRHGQTDELNAAYI